MDDLEFAKELVEACGRRLADANNKIKEFGFKDDKESQHEIEKLINIREFNNQVKENAINFIKTYEC